MLRMLTLSILMALFMTASCAHKEDEVTDEPTQADQVQEQHSLPEKSESSLVGYWASIQGGARGSWEFNDQGKLRIGEGQWMNYRLSERDSVFISMDESQGQEIFYTLSGDKLSVYFDADRQNLVSDFTRGR